MELPAALRHRSYRLFFAGQSLSLLGTWVGRFATVWMAYRLTKSPLMLGLVGFFGQAPAALLAPVAGALVDRWDRRKTLVAVQVSTALQSAALAWFAFAGTMTIAHLLVLGAVQAAINAFDTTARQAFLGEMVSDRRDLPNAVAMNSLMVNLAKMSGPVIGAVLVARIGEGWCFTVDALSTLAVIASLLAMHATPASPIPARRHATAIREGLAYVRRTPAIASVLLLFATTSLLVGAYATMLPLLAGGPHALGILMGAAGLGALAGALTLAVHTSRPSGGALLHPSVASLSIGAALVALELARSTLAAACVFFVVGASMMIVSSSSSMALQTTVGRDKIGRVMSLYAIAFYAGAPLGALLEGAVAKLVGPVHMFALAGVGCLASGLVFRRFRGAPHLEREKT